MTVDDRAVDLAAERIGPVLVRVLDRSHDLAPADLQPVLAEEAAAAGFVDLDLLLVDHRQRELTSLASGERIAVDGTLPGDAYTRGRTHARPGDGGTRLWIPLVNGRDRQGVLVLTSAVADESTERAAAVLAALAAELVMTKNPYTDEIEHARRTGEMDLAAEWRWAQIPPLTVDTDIVGISGILEPAYEIAGDTFDYALNHTTAHFAIFDAVGHGLFAARLANLAIAVYRHARRRHLDLAETCAEIDARIRDDVGESWFVTALLGELELATGELRLANAGHLRPLLLRDGRVVGEVDAPPGYPLGLGGASVPIGRTALEPGDGVVSFSDGVPESRSATGEFFGMDRLVDHLERSAAARLSAPETLRRLVARILEFEARLRDDATLLLVRWHGPARDRPTPAAARS